MPLRYITCLMLICAALTACSPGREQVRATLPADAPFPVIVDRQVAELRSRLGESQAIVEQTPEGVLITFSEAMLFELNSVTIQDRALGTLEIFADYLSTYRQSSLVITGHADARGSQHANQRLAQQRAQSLNDILVRLGISPSRLSVFSAGEIEPVGSNDTISGLATNRRVEVLLLPTR